VAQSTVDVQALPAALQQTPHTSTHSRWTTFPTDVLQQSCSRVGIMSLVIGSLWMISLLMNNVVAPLLRHDHSMMLAMGWGEDWPRRGNIVSLLGLASCALLFGSVWKHHKQPRVLISIALLFEIVTGALIVAVLPRQESLNFYTSRVSWLTILIIVFPTIVPSTPLKTLVVSFIVACLDPIAILIARANGAEIRADAFAMTWHLLPNYIAVGLAVIPSHIIAGLGRQVSQARELGSYQLGELLGRGGMGEVYRARHRMLARPAAIKLIRPEAFGPAGTGNAQVMIQRFQREAEAAALLRSPHTINLYDFGMTDDGVFYYVMELLDGLDLETLVRRFGPLPDGRVTYLLRHACHSLGEAHARGLIHRDIKPSNIFTCRLGLNVDFVKVLDFGLVKVHKHDEQERTVLLTQPDVTTGTPAFMAPEMALGETIDPRVDIYALGCVGYWLLTGKLVFEAETPVKMMLQHIQSAPVPPSEVTEVSVPPELDRILLQCLSKKPEDRPRDPATLAKMLEAVPARDCWTKERADHWWETHLPAAAPSTTLREATPVGSVHAAK
jgi:serine/threonine-protein kinase